MSFQNFKMFRADSFKNKKDPNSNTLVSFDLDQTLFTHDKNQIHIHIVDPNGNRIKSLTSKEFNRSELPDGYSYDFSDFRSSEIFIKNSRPIKKLLNIMKDIHKTNKNVEILTARGDLDDQPKFAHYMLQFGIDLGQIRVRRAGNLEIPAPQAKAAVISHLIKSNNYKTVHLYDDCMENLSAFLGLKKFHINVNFHAYHVKHNPKTGDVDIVNIISELNENNTKKRKPKK